MGLNKRTYIKGQTCITAENLNDIQDAIIALEKEAAGGDIKSMDALADIGLSGAVTMAQVCAAMPNRSQLVLSNNTTLANYVSDAPGDQGVLIVTKASVYTEASWTQASDDPMMYKGSWSAASGWSGWGQLGGLYIKELGEGLQLDASGKLSISYPDGDGVSY